MRVPTWLIVAASIVAILLGASTLYGSPDPLPAPRCTTVTETAVRGTDFQRQPGAALGAWVAPDGHVVAWSTAEDSTLWAAPECAR